MIPDVESSYIPAINLCGSSSGTSLPEKVPGASVSYTFPIATVK